MPFQHNNSIVAIIKPLNAFNEANIFPTFYRQASVQKHYRKTPCQSLVRAQTARLISLYILLCTSPSHNYCRFVCASLRFRFLVLGSTTALATWYVLKVESGA